MTKRLFDILVAGALLLFLCPFIAVAALMITFSDRSSPFYVAMRVGRHGKPFPMLKLRTMMPGADQTGVDSTAGDDPRITAMGHLLRRLKLDELPQLLNVLAGQMSLVGPRPNVKRETDLFSETERQILAVRPGITDFASVVFADEGDVLAGKPDPDIAYNQLIRPGKSRLALFYARHNAIWMDVGLLVATALAIISRPMALRLVSGLLSMAGADAGLIGIAQRRAPLFPAPPPGLEQIVTHRSANSI